ncbi:MAG: hypothetical protein ABL883_05405 [Terricaulis sp.]
MSKVIVERPRMGRAAAGLRPGRTRALVDDDGAPINAKGAREPKGRAQKTKALNETLNPLRRFLASQVGRPWNKVYSEISEHLKGTSTVQQHVRDHVEDFVAVKTRMRAGEVYVAGRWGRDMSLKESYQRLYVHPRTGLLRQNPHWKSWNAKTRAARQAAESTRALRLREVDAKTQLHCFDGVWWEVKLAKVKLHKRKDKNGLAAFFAEPFTDVVKRAKLSTLPPEELYAKPGVYAAEKRQLNKTELKRLGLK